MTHIRIYRDFVRSGRTSTYMVTSLRSGRKWFGCHNFGRKLSFIQAVFVVVTSCLGCTVRRWFFLRGTVRRTLKLTSRFSLVPPQRMRGVITVLLINRIRNLIYSSTETIWPAPVPDCNSVRLSVRSDSD